VREKASLTRREAAGATRGIAQIPQVAVGSLTRPDRPGPAEISRP
jgi:hypothetical protein